MKSLGNLLEELNRQDILDRWDNNISIYEISMTDKKKYYLKCPRGIHENELFHINTFHLRKTLCECRKCKSLAQGMIDMYGEETFNKLLSDRNTKNPWEYGFYSSEEFWWNCLDNPEHIYKQRADGKAAGQGCSLCNNTSIVHTSLLDEYPSIIKIWSNRNIKSPNEYSSHSGQRAWFKCKNGLHEDFYRIINSLAKRDFRCPECGKNIHKEKENISRQIFGELTALEIDYKRTNSKGTFWKCKCSCGKIKSIKIAHLKNGSVITCGNRTIHNSGENSNNWKGGITPKNLIERTSRTYINWRNSVYAKDWYTCQCCGSYGNNIVKHAHHIKNFSNNEPLRYDINNGITLCDNCHYSTKYGSFHNIYGTANNTPEQLEEYINNKRKQLGINLKFSINKYLAGNILKPKKEAI